MQWCVAVRGGVAKQLRSRRRSAALASSSSVQRCAYSTRAHRLSGQQFDAPGNVVGVAPMAALEPAYDDAQNPALLLDQDIKALLEARIPIQQLREIGKQKLSGRALMLWQLHVTALERKLQNYATELHQDLSLYQLADAEVRAFPTWSFAVRALFDAAKATQVKEERYKRDAAGLALDATATAATPSSSSSSSSSSTTNTSGTAASMASLSQSLSAMAPGLSFDAQGFPLLGMDWQLALTNKKAEFHWSDQPVVILAVKNCRTALQPATSAAGSRKDSLLSVLDATPTTVLLERLLVIDFIRRKLILSERVARGDAGVDFDPSVRHAEAWKNFVTRINALFDAPKPDTTSTAPAAAAAPADASSPSAASQTAAASSPSSLLSKSAAPSSLVKSILAEGDRLKRPVVESAERLSDMIRDEIRVVEQLEINANTGGRVPAALPMTPAHIEAIVHRIRTHTLSQSRLSAATLSDRAITSNMGITSAAGRTIARPTAATAGVPARLAPEAERHLEELKNQLIQLLEVLAAKVAAATDAIDRRAVRDAEAGIVTGTDTNTASDDLESLGLPSWRQRVYTIPPNLLLSLKQLQWPRSQHDLYEQDRNLLRRFSSTREVSVAVGTENSWTDHLQQLRKSLGPDIADLSQLAAINEVAASAAASLTASRPAAASATATAAAAAAPAE